MKRLLKKKSKTRKVHSLEKKSHIYLKKKLLVEDSGHENAIRPNQMKMYTQHNFGHPLAELFSAFFFFFRTTLLRKWNGNDLLLN